MYNPERDIARGGTIFRTTFWNYTQIIFLKLPTVNHFELSVNTTVGLHRKMGFIFVKSAERFGKIVHAFMKTVRYTDKKL